MIKKLIVIEGPTASGKTALAIVLATHFNTEIVSADSRQFYKEMSIGTAKPSLDEQAGIVHHFIDSHTIHDPLTSAAYEREALAVLETIFEKHDVAILVGGSGMFIDALCNGLDDIPANLAVRAEWDERLKTEGIEALQKALQEVDPDFYAQVDLQNPMRIIRALEVFELTGKPFSTFKAFTPKKRFFEIQKFVIDLPRETLYNRINQRVDNMIQQGLVEEAKSLHPFKHIQALNTVGYTELFAYFDHTTDLETAIELIKRNSRRYAKRQLTWFRRDASAIWLDANELNEQVNEVISHLKPTR